MEEFFTREKANKGVKLPLVHPDGSESKHWLIIRNIQSDLFRQKIEDDARRRLEFARPAEGDEKKEEFIETTHEELLSTLIADWSFDEECTEENKIKFLTEAPQIAEEIDKFAANKKRFFAQPSKSCTDTSEKSLL